MDGVNALDRVLTICSSWRVDDDRVMIMSRRNVALAAGVAGPLAAAVALVPFRDRLANTNAALVLVLIVVAVAATGSRPAGVAAALSAGVWFDFFLTVPFQRLAIDDPSDVETAVLLLLVGLGVSELAVWGRRQQAEASQQAGYVAGIQDAVDATIDVTTPVSPSAVIDNVKRQLTRLLSLRACRFDYGSGVIGGGNPRLRSDGQVEISGAICDVARYGLPVEHDIELLLIGEGGYRGRFLLSAQPDSRPSLAQRLAAVALADQAAAALALSRRLDQ
jgi:hypothetical protein